MYMHVKLASYLVVIDPLTHKSHVVIQTTLPKKIVVLQNAQTNAQIRASRLESRAARAHGIDFFIMLCPFFIVCYHN